MNNFRSIRVLVLILLLGMSFFLTEEVHAQNSQTLSVTPPLFQMSALPGDIWQSNLKVVNGNPYPMTVYAEVVNFEAMGEKGQGKFVPVLDHGGDPVTLAEWIEIAPGPHTIPPEKTKEISFFVEIPKTAPPGGHYAAILITTKPTAGDLSDFSVQTSQAVTSLFMVRIEGDVHEEGSIREFRALDGFVPKPEVELSLRFENKGNVHLQPRGDIIITNMWGTERGTIPINYQTNFGNVLPESIRDFKFTWQSDLSFTDVGRYKALVTLGYGENGVKSVTSTTYFWVVPVKITLITLSVLAVFVGLIILMVRLYIRRMLLLAGVPMTKKEVAPVPAEPVAVRQSASTYRKVSAPIRSGVLDLRNRLKEAPSENRLEALAGFISQYRIFFVSVIVILIIVVATASYINKATDEHDDYRVIIDEGDGTTVLEGSEIENLER